MRKRMRADWVYRGNVWLSDGSLGDGRASYHSSPTSVPTGSSNAAGKVLYDSYNYLQESVGVVPIGAQLNRAARAEARKPFIHRVAGHIVVQPSSWAVGNILQVAAAVIIAPQEATSGAPLVDSDFSLWSFNTGDPQVAPNVYANWTNVIAIRRMHRAFSDNGAMFVMPVNCRVRRSLSTEQCIFLYFEASDLSGGGGSINCTIIPWLRTLVSDEG